MKSRVQNVFSASLFVFAVLLLFTTGGFAEKIILVSAGQLDPDGLPWEQEWVDLLTDKGYEVERQDATMTGTALTSEQIDILESADLIIFSRGAGSGDYNAPFDWNAISKPLMLLTSYVSRTSRWNWLSTDDLINGGDSGAPIMYVDKPEHPLFAGVTLDANKQLEFVDGSIGSGNSSLSNVPSAGNGEVIASTADLGTPWLIYWPPDVFFHDATDQQAGGKRLLFQAGTRESTLVPPIAEFGWCMYNLTPEGTKVFLNAVAFMLGKDTQVADAPSAPVDYAIMQNYPNPFNPQTTIRFALPTATMVSVRVFDVLGHEVTTLTNQFYAAGTHQVIWNGRDTSGKALESGVYFYKLEAGTFTQTNKMMLIK